MLQYPFNQNFLNDSSLMNKDLSFSHNIVKIIKSFFSTANNSTLTWQTSQKLNTGTHTILEWARRKNHEEIVRLLEAAAAGLPLSPSLELESARFEKNVKDNWLQWRRSWKQSRQRWERWWRWLHCQVETYSITMQSTERAAMYCFVLWHSCYREKSIFPSYMAKLNLHFSLWQTL